MSYNRSGGYGSRYNSPSKAATPPPADNARLTVGTDMNTITSFQKIRDWLQEIVQEKGIKMKTSDVENRALAAWQSWQRAWKTQSTDAVVFQWDESRNNIVAV